MKRMNFAKLAHSFGRADAKLELTPEGNGRMHMDEKSLKPTAPPGVKPVQTLAQHEAVKKAARASGLKRSARAGKLSIGPQATAFGIKKVL